MGVNADSFLRELKAETKALERDFVEFRADLVRDLLRVSSSRTPVRKGVLIRKWGANAGSKPDFDSWNGSAGAHDALRGPSVKAGTRVWAGNAHFIASFHEKGTNKMRARPMLRVGIEHVSGREEKA